MKTHYGYIWEIRGFIDNYHMIILNKINWMKRGSYSEFLSWLIHLPINSIENLINSFQLRTFLVLKDDQIFLSDFYFKFSLNPPRSYKHNQNSKLLGYIIIIILLISSIRICHLLPHVYLVLEISAQYVTPYIAPASFRARPWGQSFVLTEKISSMI